MRSFEKFSYLLRPAKQVERKLLIHSLHRLGLAGYKIQNYTYLGFGSVYYADFVLFHRYLYIDDMICVEVEEIPRRMRFNKPYRFIRLHMKDIQEVIPRLSRQKRFFVWLDYDIALEASVLDAIDGLIQAVAKESILLFTVDARPRLPEEMDDPKWNESERSEQMLAYFNEAYRGFAGGEIFAQDLSEQQYPTLLARILRQRIKKSLLGRPGLQFLQLYNFLYADNAPMITIGGLIDSEETEGKIWANNCLGSLGYLRHHTGEVPIEIRVPPLTERERHWLDRNLVRAPHGVSVPFELDRRMLRAYKTFARYYPSYHEAIV